MTTRMLIDARHREETRVAVVKGNRIEEFDFESAERKQLKGNIYLAKVTRVEPSLQAAFIDYGGNRHGFLAFSEIHPDYYQIPKEDREALLREEAEHAAEEAALRSQHDDDDDGEHDEAERETDELADTDEHDDGEEHDAEPVDGTSKKPRGDDQVEALRQRRMNLRRRYKIQDVIRRRQVLLVQVVKEERGNKGAALTTYLSLAGRYCVLMPNTSHGGGISRKISNVGDRKRLKSIMADLKLPSSMGCIVRTAGLQRTRVEIKRDFDYLARLWDEIREKTLGSAAPALIYGDSDLMKRAIRDIYNRDIDEVIVEGEEGYRQAKEFMRLLMPSHARKVKQYADAVPLFQRANVEDQLAAMYHPVVQLKSGGYLVINPTEALVSIDINSGRSTREHNIEQTATATNLEAAQEIARQLRLRDMAGLVVIDFIDMDNGSNVRKVEKAMKEALKDDRARIQVGRISQFGLLEMSRQRLRTGVLEASTRACPHCEGTGLVRTASSAGLSALRLIEDEAARGRGSIITLRASQEAAIYVLNRKRDDIAEIEERYGVAVEIFPDREEEGARMAVEASGPPPAHAPRIEALVVLEDDNADDPEIEDEEDEIEAEEEPRREARTPRGEPREGGREARGPAEAREGGRKRRRRRGRRSGGPEEIGEPRGGEEAGNQLADPAPVGSDTAPIGAADAAPEQEGEGARRRRGRRGRRGRRSGAEGAERQVGAEDASGEAPAEPIADAADAGPITSTLAIAAEHAEQESVSAGVPDADEDPVAEAPISPKPRRRPRARTADAETQPTEMLSEPEAPPVEASTPTRRSRKVAADETATADVAPAGGEIEAAPKRRSRKKVDAAVSAAQANDPDASEPAPSIESPEAATFLGGTDAENGNEALAAEAEATDQPRRGWWQRTFGA